MADTEQERKVGHTPGPWLARLESTRFVIQHEPSESPGLRAIAVTAGSYPLSEANARLIAAAPDLLEALRAIMGDLNSAEDLSDVVGRFVSTEFYHRAATAIARATGGAS